MIMLAAILALILKPTMRYLLPGILFFVISCSEQHKQENADQHLKIDTTKLFDPNPQVDTVKNSTILNHCLMLDNDSLEIVLNEQKYKLYNIKDLKEFLQTNSTSITTQKFYIIYVISTPTKKIFEVINIVKTAKIENYKVLSFSSLFELNVPQ